jgi:hypothetical protein
MPLSIDNNLPQSFPTPSYLTLTSWRKGVISLLDKSRLPVDALEQADNMYLVEDGQPTVRPGVDWFGTAVPNGQPIDGGDYFDLNGTIHLVVVAGGIVYRSLDDGQNWTQCTGFTMTAGQPVETNQYNNSLYLTTPTDDITLYDGTTTLQRYTSLATPAAPSAVETGLTGSGIPYYYKVSRVNTIGFSASSPVNTGAVDSNLARSAWSSGTNYVTLTTPTAVTGQTRWDFYISEDNINFYYLSSVVATPGSTSVFIDNGTSIPVPSTVAPTQSTAGGPPVAELTNVGSRMWGVRDRSNRYRIWFSSGNPPLGAFSSAYDGGYIDWAPGGKDIPNKVIDYRDGKGTPYATVFCDSADGQGCIIQVSLDIITVGDVSITVPSAYRLPGSRGTPSPGSVVNVLNDYMFYNSQAFYNLGSRAQFLNLLSTDEASANIRPSVKEISVMGEQNITSVYFDAKVLFSVPKGSTINNTTMVYDTERKAWLPTAFTRGFKKFLRYTTTSGASKLLAIGPGDNRLSEISQNIQGDYGTAFTSTLRTGLYAVSKNRFEFQWTEEAEIELSNPSGTIRVELIGLERSKGFTSQATASITSTLSNTGWDTFLWDSTLWDDTSNAPDTYSESSVKRYFRIGKELNAVQWQLTTNSLEGNYVLRTLQTWGTNTQSTKPRAWRISTI